MLNNNDIFLHGIFIVRTYINIFKAEMVNLLLNLKLDPNLKDKRNRSPLDDALRFQHPRVSSILKSLNEKSSPDLAPSIPRRVKKSVDVQVRNFRNINLFISIF